MPEALNTPRDFVQSGWDYFRALSNEWILLSQQAIGDLTNLDIVPISFEDADFDLVVDYGSFVRPEKPLAPTIDEVAVVVPDAPTVTPIEFTDPGAPPEEPDFSGLSYVAPAPPDVTLPNAPTDTDVALVEIEIPEFDTYTLPAVPTLYDLNIPDAPEIAEVEFEAVRPDFDIALPDSAFNWTEVAYSSTLLDSVKTNLASLMNGGLGLPAEVEQALFDRARGRADVLAQKRVQEVSDDLAARGLVEPAGYLARRLDAARQDARLEQSTINSDITIESAKISVESVRFALTQAVALEIALLEQNGQINQRALEAAKVGADIAMNVFNAQVARYNLEVELYKADAEVFKQRIQASIARAELFKAEIDGQKAIGEINESLIRAYAAEISTISTLADIYRARVDAAKARGEINVQRLEQARLRVQTYSAQVDAFGKAHDAYKSQVDGALGNVRVYEAMGGVYGQRVNAYRAVGEAYIEQGKARIAAQQLNFAGYQSQLEGVRAQLQVQVANVQAQSQLYASKAAMYQAEGQVVQAESAAHDRTASLRVEVARARLEAALKTIEARIGQNGQIYGLYVEQLKAKAQVLTQLSAATMSGVNFGAQYNGSLTHAYQSSASIGWQGEMTDFGASFSSFPLF